LQEHETQSQVKMSDESTQMLHGEISRSNLHSVQLIATQPSTG